MSIHVHKLKAGKFIYIMNIYRFNSKKNLQDMKPKIICHSSKIFRRKQMSEEYISYDVSVINCTVTLKILVYTSESVGVINTMVLRIERSGDICRLLGDANY